MQVSMSLEEYEELKREVSILKRALTLNVFGTPNEDDWVVEMASTVLQNAGHGERSQDAIL